jgi:hypothetical protein
MKCPGQDTQYWTASAIFEALCPECGMGVEFFKDDTTRKCPACGHRFINPNMDFGCASYCPYAEQCLGDLPPELVAQKEDLLKDKVAVAVKRHLKSDFKTIGRAVRRGRHAEEIGKKAQVNMAVVLMAAFLWELDGPVLPADTAEVPVAKGLLNDLMTPQPLVEQVSQVLISARSPHPDQGIAELKVVLEAQSRVAAEDRAKTGTPAAV